MQTIKLPTKAATYERNDGTFSARLIISGSTLGYMGQERYITQEQALEAAQKWLQRVEELGYVGLEARTRNRIRNW